MHTYGNNVHRVVYSVVPRQKTCASVTILGDFYVKQPGVFYKTLLEDIVASVYEYDGSASVEWWV